MLEVKRQKVLCELDLVGDNETGAALNCAARRETFDRSVGGGGREMESQSVGGLVSEVCRVEMRPIVSERVSGWGARARPCAPRPGERARAPIS